MNWKRKARSPAPDLSLQGPIASGPRRPAGQPASRSWSRSTTVPTRSCSRDLPPRLTASSPTSARRAWSAKNFRLPVRTIRRPSRPFSSRLPRSTRAWSCMPPRCPSTRARRPAAFAVAANLPRRSGTAQLNHLVASLFAHGLRLDPSYLYARRRPQRIALDASSAPARSLPGLDLGFPELKLSDALIARLRERSSSAPDLSQKFSRELVCVNRETEASTHGLHHENNRHVNCDTKFNINMYVNGNGHHGGLGNVLPSGMPDLLIAPVQPHLPEQAILEAAHDAKHPSPAE